MALQKFSCQDFLKLSVSLTGHIPIVLLNLRSISFGNSDRLAKSPLLISAGRTERENQGFKAAGSLSAMFRTRLMFIISSLLITEYEFTIQQRSLFHRSTSLRLYKAKC